MLKFGWIPDTLDKRDYYFKVVYPVDLPGKFDLMELQPSIYHQGSLGSCTANGIGGLFQYCQKKQGIDDFIPSRLFIYYNERKMEHTIKIDCGAMIRDGIKVIKKYGACKETTWPYEINKFDKKPPVFAYNEGKSNQILKYERVNQIKYEIMHRIAIDKFPITLGISLYESFMSPEVSKTGIVPLPNFNKEKLLGGHCVNLVGYDFDEATFLMRNSWGIGWGNKGYFTIPMEYILDPDLCADLWTIQLVED